MVASDRCTDRCRFPLPPDAADACNLWLRPFGTCPADLEVDLLARPRPHLVTRLLRLCTERTDGEPPDESFFWGLSLGKRIECLFCIATAGGARQLLLQLVCRNTDCGGRMEIRLTSDEVSEMQSGADRAERVVVPAEAGEARFRRPTGSDQLLWLEGVFEGEGGVRKAMIESLLVRDTASTAAVFPATSIEEAGRALAEADPLVGFSPAVACPHCGAVAEHSVDLEARLLGELRLLQRQLLKTVHVLATHYHWNEREILSIPPARRQQYLAMVEEERLS